MRSFLRTRSTWIQFPISVRSKEQSVRCVLLNCDDCFVRDVFVRFAAKPGVEVAAVRGVNEVTKQVIHTRIPGCEVSIFADDLHPYELKGIKDAYGDILSKGLIEEYSKVESLFLEMTDRFCAFPLPVSKLKEIYYRYLAKSIRFFEEKDIDFVLSNEQPHMGFDYVFCEVAKRKGINVFVVELTLLDNTVLLNKSVSERYVPTDYLADATDEEIEDLIPDRVKSSIGFDGLTYKWTLVTGSEYKIASNSRFLMDTLKELVFLVLQKKFWLRDRKFKSFLALNDRAMRWGGAVGTIKFLLFRKNRKLVKYYGAISQDHIPSDKYVFFAMHYQPERTTSPQGDVFRDQLMAIEALASALPEGWVVAVKEHPRQFRGWANSLHARSKEYYQKMKSISNVRVIGLGVPSGELIRSSQAVATIGGTAGWEALAYDKPVMAFGWTWYSGCPGVFDVDGAEACRKVFSGLGSLKPGFASKGRLRFVAWNKDRFIPGAVASYLVKTDDIEGLKESMVSSMYDRIVANCQ